MAHLVISPLVVVPGSDGSDRYTYRGGLLPGDLDADTVRRLVEDGHVREVPDAEEPRVKPADATPGPESPTDHVVDLADIKESTAAQVLAWVGEDQGKAQEALAAEQGRGDDARKGLTADLTSIAERQA